MATMPESIEVPEGGLASFLTATVGDWADNDIPDTGIGSVKAVADQLAEYGRYEDTYMVHAAEGETVVPMAVFEENPRLKESLFRQMRSMGIDPERYVVGNELNSINPVTGQPEFFLKKLFRGIKKAIKSVVKVVKKVAPIVLSIGLSMTPLGPIFGSALGSGIGTLVQGGDFKAALKSALIGGAIGGLTTGISGGVKAVRAGDTFASGFGQNIKSALPGASKAAEQAIAADIAKQTAGIDAAADATTQKILSGSPGAAATQGSAIAGARPAPTGYPGLTVTAPAGAGAGAGAATTLGSISDATAGGTGAVGAQTVTPPTTPDLTTTTDIAPEKMRAMETPGVRESLGDLFSGEKGILETGKDIFFPKQTQGDILAKYGLTSGTASPDQLAMAKQLAADANSGIGLIRSYGPLALAGTGIMAATGGFEAPVSTVPEAFDGITGWDLLQKDPSKYRVGVPSYPVTGSRFNRGGNVNYPRKNGAISGPGTETSDDIPAMLSDGEFVMTARAVRGAGNGSRKNGVRKMYQLMRSFEGVA